MPFDGTYFPAPRPSDTGLFPIWSRHGCRLWFGARLRRDRRDAATLLRAPHPADRDLAVAGLLREAKGLIDDPET